MTTSVNNALDDVKRQHDELTRALSSLFPKFRDASERLVHELTRKVQDMERQEELYRVRAENDKTRIEKLEEENQLLRQDKQEHDKLRAVFNRQSQKLDEYSNQIDLLNDQNKQLNEQCRVAERDLSTLRLKNNELNSELTRKVREFEELGNQFELDKRTELSNQATEHLQAMAKTKRTFQDSLRQLEADFERQKKELRDRDKEITRLNQELKVMPIKIRASLMQTFQKEFSTAAKQPIHIPLSSSRQRLSGNPVKPMREALAGSSLSSSTSSSSSYSRRRNSEEPIRKRPHY